MRSLVLNIYVIPYIFYVSINHRHKHFILFPVDYINGQSPHVLETGSYTQTANPPKIALSPNAEVLAVAVDSSVEFYDTYTGKLYDTVENVYLGERNILPLVFIIYMIQPLVCTSR